MESGCKRWQFKWRVLYTAAILKPQHTHILQKCHKNMRCSLFTLSEICVWRNLVHNSLRYITTHLRVFDAELDFRLCCEQTAMIIRRAGMVRKYYTKRNSCFGSNGNGDDSNACSKPRFTHFCVTPQTCMLGCQQDSLRFHLCFVAFKLY